MLLSSQLFLPIYAAEAGREFGSVRFVMCNALRMVSTSQKYFLAARARFFLILYYGHSLLFLFSATSFCRLVLRLFVVIRIVNSFHEQFAVVNLIRQCRFQ